MNNGISLFSVIHPRGKELRSRARIKRILKYAHGYDTVADLVLIMNRKDGKSIRPASRVELVEHEFGWEVVWPVFAKDSLVETEIDL